MFTTPCNASKVHRCHLFWADQTSHSLTPIEVDGRYEGFPFTSRYHTMECKISILPRRLYAVLERGYWDAVEVGPFDPDLGLRLLHRGCFLFDTTTFCQLIALSHYAGLF